ncbi:uncharacterized protein LOC135150383 [Daucus carota subsp. sativus]|uniref:uncharacterized protein LOC135150383 n=1 Tax=Daucus carota subsp. sativus TaxID=79200 RepID=UPI003083DC4A
MVLTSALAEKEYKRVNNCKSAQEMWNKLVVTYEGTTDIKDSRMDTLIQEYKNFKLQDGENIIDMETRFTRIIDELSQLGKNYTQNDKNRRVLKSLPSSWKVKVTTIKEMHNLNDYHIDNLFGNLRAYEEDNVPDIVVPKVEDKKKNMALKSILIDEDENDEVLNEEIQNLDESEIALLTRQLRRVLQSKAQRYGKGFLKSNNQQRVFNSNRRLNYSQNYSPNYKSNFPTNSGYKGKNNQSPNGYNNANTSNNNNYTPPKPKEQNPEETQDVCFECKQPGHYKRECPKLSKGRILVAENGWDLSEDEESSEASEEVVNLCLMAIEDASTSTDISTTNQELLVEANTRYDYLDQLFLTTWSEKEKLEDIYQTQQKEFSRIKESKIKLEEEMVNLQDSFIKSKDAITKLEIENVSLILETEEIKEEKLQLNENIEKLHVDLLNLKIQNESLTQERSTTSYLKDSLETEIARILEEKEKEFKIETRKIKDEHSNILAQCKDQERILNAQIDALINDKNDLERTIQRFTKGNEMLDRMECLVAKQNMWYLDSGCSRHMTGNKSLLNDIKKVTAGVVTFGDSSKDYLTKFDPKSSEGIFLGYSSNSKAYRVFNLKTLVVEESMNVAFDEAKPPSKYIDLVDKEDAQQDGIENVIRQFENLDVGISPPNNPLELLNQDEELPKEIPIIRSHPLDNVLGDLSKGVQTRSQVQNVVNHLSFLSQIEPKIAKEALLDEDWISAMQDELNQFTRSKVWELVPKPEDTSIIGTKWVFRNKLDENGTVVRNKARLVAQGYTQMEGIDFDETYTPLARIESILMLLAFACHKGFKVYQMDVKSAFLNGILEEEVYVKQPPCFEDSVNPEYVYKLYKALYGSKQAPRAWYERLSKFLLDNNFKMGTADKTLFTRQEKMIYYLSKYT